MQWAAICVHLVVLRTCGGRGSTTARGVKGPRCATAAEGRHLKVMMWARVIS
jgi:hypothetical protein